MMQLNFPVILAVAVIPMIIGSIWYSPKVFGKAWMNAAGLTEAEVNSGNMMKILGGAFIFSLMLSTVLATLVIHQFNTQGLFVTQPEFADPQSTMHQFFDTFMKDYSGLHRSFGHGAVHGGFLGVFVALPIIGMISLFERKGWKYILVHWGYWMLSLVLMSGVISQFF